MTASGTTKVSGATLRSAAGLRSTWITALGSLSLSRPGGPAVYGKALTVTGKAAGHQGRGAQPEDRRSLAAAPRPEREGEAARALELPHLRRQGRRPGAEGSRGAARPPRSGRPEPVRNRQAARGRHDGRAPAALGRRLVDGSRGDLRRGGPLRRGRAPSPACTAPGPRRHRASPRGSPRSSRFRDPASHSSASRRRCSLPPRTRRATPSARPRSPTCRACSARSARVRRASRRCRRSSSSGRRRRVCRSCPARPTWSGSACAASAWVPNDPLKQWHLSATRAFDFWDAAPSPPLAAVRVAVIDSGIDATHPEFAGQDRRRGELRRRLRPRRQRGPRHVRRRADRARASTTRSGSRAWRRPPSCSSPRS